MSDERDLEREFNELRSVRYSDSKSEVLEWLEHAERKRSRVPGARHWRDRIRAYAAVHRLHLATAFGVLLLIAACQTPVEHNATFAYVLSGRIAEPPAAARERIAALGLPPASSVQVLGVVTGMVGGKEEEMAYVASGRAIVDGREITTPTSKFVILLPRSSGRDMDTWQHALRELEVVTSVVLEPVQQRVRQPAYKVVFQSFSYEFEPSIPADSATRRIEAHLRDLNLDQIVVRADTTHDGIAAIRLEWPGLDGRAGRRQNRALERFLDDMRSEER